MGGIDEPEKKQPFGRQSTKNLAGYVAGKNVEFEYTKRDRYKRIIGKLLLDGQDINLQQVRDGYASHYKYYQKNQLCVTEYFIAKLKMMHISIILYLRHKWQKEKNE